MKNFEFPIFKTKMSGPRFALEDPVERHKYFEYKAGPEIEKLKDYLRIGTFVAILLGKKNSGKGTYTKLFMEAIGGDRVIHISIGDVVRNAHRELEDANRRPELVDFLNKRYRGFLTVDEVINVILGRDTKTLLPTEAILALVEREIGRAGQRRLRIQESARPRPGWKNHRRAGLQGLSAGRGAGVFHSRQLCPEQRRGEGLRHTQLDGGPPRRRRQGRVSGESRARRGAVAGRGKTR